MDQLQRPRFYEGQHLSAEDLSTLEAYFRARDARHALGAHTWGIAVGLDLVESTLPSGKVRNILTPGYAWDGYGRPIVVLGPVEIQTKRFADFVGETLDGGTLVKVWLRYAERETRLPAPGFEICGGQDQHARVVETYAIEVGTPANNSHQVSVAGTNIRPAKALRPSPKALFDESVPFQDFPDGDKQRWLVPIGYVRWSKEQGDETGQFVALDGTDHDLSRGVRRHIGVVAAALYAPDGLIRVRDRSRPLDDHTRGDLVHIEGDLSVEGHARVVGGQLEWRASDGSGKNTPTLMRRKGDENKSPGGRSLEVVLGTSVQSNNRFAVGPIVGGGADETFLDQLTVLSSGKVGINNAAPNASLQVKSLTTIDEGDEGGRTWANFGQNAHFDGDWKRVDNMKDGVNLHMSPAGDGQEFRFCKVIGQCLPSNIAALGTETSFILKGNFGVGTDAPASTLDVNGAIYQHGAPFFASGDAEHGDKIIPPTNFDDWNIILSPMYLIVVNGATSDIDIPTDGAPFEYSTKWTAGSGTDPGYYKVKAVQANPLENNKYYPVKVKYLVLRNKPPRTACG